MSEIRCFIEYHKNEISLGRCEGDIVFSFNIFLLHWFHFTSCFAAMKGNILYSRWYHEILHEKLKAAAVFKVGGKAHVFSARTFIFKHVFRLKSDSEGMLKSFLGERVLKWS